MAESKPDLRAAKSPERRDFLKSVGAASSVLATGGAMALVSPRAVQAAALWDTVPNQQWAVGEPVYLDLADYFTHDDIEAVSFSLNRALPPGVALNGSVISGTPTADFPTTVFQVTAEDDIVVPNPPGNLTLTG